MTEKKIEQQRDEWRMTKEETKKGRKKGSKWMNEWRNMSRTWLTEIFVSEQCVSVMMDKEREREKERGRTDQKPMGGEGRNTDWFDRKWK